MIIENGFLIADEGKVLRYIPRREMWGKKARLGVAVLGKTLVEEDFDEIEEEDLEYIDGVWYDFRNMTYAAIKTFIIKLRYSNDDQIAIMLNGDQERYDTMQAWREYAREIATKYTKK